MPEFLKPEFELPDLPSGHTDSSGEVGMFPR